MVMPLFDLYCFFCSWQQSSFGFSPQFSVVLLWVQEMGFISRKLYPACESMCVCCPALRSRSRQPVKRYKKLLADIFPKSLDGPPNERKLVKLCEYAAKNPFRIPKIAKYLEERCYKELRNEHIKFVNIVAEAYKKLLCMCKEQMAYFAINLLNVVSELLDKSKQEASLILGCQTLTRFIYSQADGTYTHNIEKFVQRICKLAHGDGDKCHRSRLRTSSLQCLAAMVWFMAEFSYVFASFDEVVHATLDNYEPEIHVEEDEERGEPHHNWVDEVVRCESRVPILDGDGSGTMIIRRPEKKDPSLLTREEIETPKVWAQICIQRMVELAKESTTMRRVLDPTFVYFDSGRHWIPRQGLAMIVLSDMSYFLETSGHQQLVLAAVIRHLDHKNIAHDPQIKSSVIQIAAVLARHIRPGAVLAEIGIVSDLCRHLRKSLQATAESAGEQESNLNIPLQNSIEVCLLKIAKRIGDARALFDMMSITLEKLPSSGVVAHSTLGSLIVLAHVISLSSVSSRSQQVFPEELLVQLLKAMLHPDVEVRVGAHQIFSLLLMPRSIRHRHEVASLRPGYIREPRKWRSDTASAFASIAALLEKLRKEKDGATAEKQANNGHDNCKEIDITEEDWKQGRGRKNTPNFYKISSLVDRTAGASSFIEEPHIMKLTEDQIAQLLSAFWIQANLPDNMPSNFEAIAHSFMLTLVSSQLKNTNDSLVARFFQLSLSLMSLSLGTNTGMPTPACQRSILLVSIGMLMSAAKVYQIPELSNLLKALHPWNVDPYLGISDECQVHVKPLADVREYGSARDNQLAMTSLNDLRGKILESNKAIIDIIVLNLAKITGLDRDDLVRQLSEPFTPDDALVFGPRSVLEVEHNEVVSNSRELISFDEDIPTSFLVEDDLTSEPSVADMSCFIPKMPASPSVSHVISIGQLLESALEVAGQVAGTSISTSPLPYDTMAKHCEALGTGTRKKLSNWLAHEYGRTRTPDKLQPAFHSNGHPVAWKGPVKPIDPSSAIRLPPASPYDNFLKAAGC